MDNIWHCARKGSAIVFVAKQGYRVVSRLFQVPEVYEMAKGFHAVEQFLLFRQNY